MSTTTTALILPDGLNLLFIPQTLDEELECQGYE